MSGYAEEIDRDDIESWKSAQFEQFEFSYDDVQLAKLVENKLLEGEDLEAALHRLCQIAAVTGSIQARTSLAKFGGIGLNEATLFTGAVNVGVDELQYSTADDEIIRRARAKKRSGDYNGYLALSGVVGIYPPEAGDSIPVTDSASANPFYDSNRFYMRDVQYASLVGAIGNHG